MCYVPAEIDPSAAGSNVGAAAYEALRLRVLALDSTSRSKRTSLSYRNRVAELGKRFERECTVPVSRETAWSAFVEWIISRKADWSASTWRQYKSAVVFVGIRLTRKGSLSLDGMEATLVLSSEPQTGSSPKGRATSAHKRKRFPKEDMNKILDNLMRSHSKHSNPLAIFLQANLVAGLRPIEWTQACVVADPGFALVLQVANAKDTHGRSHGQLRHLRWRTIADVDRDVIVEMLEISKPYAGRPAGFDAFTKSLQRLLRETCQALWPRRRTGYTLYDTRHDFAARAKLVYEPEEVAALMGHGSDETATRHYGRLKAGSMVVAHDRVLPEPDPEEVQRVRQVLRSKLLIRSAVSFDYGQTF
jgi:integrase